MVLAMIAVAGCCPLPPPGPGASYFVYVANHDSDTISAYAMDAATGALTAVAGSPFDNGPGSNPMNVCADPAGKFLYVANQAGSVSAYAIDAASGALAPVPGSPFAAGANSQAIAVDPAGKFLYAVNYDSTNISAYTIDAASGALAPVPGSPFAAGADPMSAAVDPSGRFLYVGNMNPCQISAYTIDAASGALAPVPGSPFASPTGSPMSLAVHPNGRFLYVPSFASSWYDFMVYDINTTTGALTVFGDSPYRSGWCSLCGSRRSGREIRLYRFL